MTDKERLELIHGKMKTVVPLTGNVMINGSPQSGVVIKLYNEDGINIAPIAPAVTDSDGNFGFTTYIKADGVVPGKYKLTFEWFETVRDKKLGNQMKGPDKLQKAYNDPSSSKYTITVQEDEPQTDLEFHLTTNN